MTGHRCPGDTCHRCQQRIDAIETDRLNPGEGLAADRDRLADVANDRYLDRCYGEAPGSAPSWY